ncbi:MAG: dienelactone hydrolase family protein [Proteobacteria bacterium]|nr:dienelactone hydrolase family protein [Pseudomonadota bacterium]
MKTKKWKGFVCFLISVSAVLILSSCEEESTIMCTSDVGLESDDYQSAVVCYPCDMGEGLYPAVSLTGGFTNTKEQMQNQAEAFVAEGIIVIGATPKGNYTLDHTNFQKAHNAAYDKLKVLNADPDSVIYNKIDTDRMGQVGFSMGGGAVLLNAQSNPGDIKATVAICPFYPAATATSFNKVSNPVMIIAGTNDILAWPYTVFNMKESVLEGPHDRVVYANFEGMTHFEMYGDMNENMAKTIEYSVAFLKTQLDGDNSFETVLSGEVQAQHEAEGWFHTYELYGPNESNLSTKWYLDYMVLKAKEEGQ